MSELDGWKLCPRCGAELGGDAARLACDACGFIVYASSKPTAGALCVHNGRVLLARRGAPSVRGLLGHPGRLPRRRRGTARRAATGVEGGDGASGRAGALSRHLDGPLWRGLDGGGNAESVLDGAESSAATRRRPTTSPSSAGSTRTSCPAPNELAFENVPLVLGRLAGRGTRNAPGSRRQTSGS